MYKFSYSSLLLIVSGIAIVATAPVYAQQEEPGFDIINKSGVPVTIAIISDYHMVKQEVVYPTTMGSKLWGSSKNVSANLDIDKATLLLVAEGIIKGPIYAMRAGGGGEGKPNYLFNWLISSKDVKHYIFHFTLGKKIYVTLHKDGELDPQTGPKNGTTGKTEAGYSLENMVEKSDIMTGKRW